MKYSLLALGVLVATTYLVNAVPPPDTLIEKTPHLFDSAPPGTRWVDAFGEVLLPEKYEWGHYVAKQLDLGGARCKGNTTSSNHLELERRAVTCPPGYVQNCPDNYPRPCCLAGYPICCSPDAYICCPSGYFCQGTTACCPSGSIGCGGGCCTGGTKCCGNVCCNPGLDCAGGQCVVQCGGGQVKCGTGCCNAGSTCCGTTCCPSGYHCTGETCVKDDPCAGKVTCGTGCCDAGNTCCNNGAACCAAGSTCCGTTCCSSGYHCTNGQCVKDEQCPQKVTCGTGCCDAGNTCCNNGTLCCAAGTSCCDTKCCLSGYTCQSGQCVADNPCPGKVQCSATTCCNTGTTCCGNNCCGTGSTCQNGTCVADDPCPGKVRCSSGCCPAGTECSDGGCCTRGKNCPGDPPQCNDPSQDPCPGKTFCCPRGYTCPDSISGFCTPPATLTTRASSTIPIPATILSLPPPEPSSTDVGPRTVDVPPSDPNIQYQPAGAWSDSVAGSALGICTNNTKVSSQAGATVSYTFTGIAVGVKIVRGKKAMTYRIGVDGQFAGSLDSFSPNTVCTPEIGGGKEGLANGPHTVTITLDGPSSSSGAAGPLFEFSGITVITAGTIAGNGDGGTLPITSSHVLVSCAVLLFASLLWGS